LTYQIDIITAKIHEAFAFPPKHGVRVQYVNTSIYLPTLLNPFVSNRYLMSIHMVGTYHYMLQAFEFTPFKIKCTVFRVNSYCLFVPRRNCCL